MFPFIVPLSSSSSSFSTSYKCYSSSFFCDNLKSCVEKGGKIIMPPSALQTLTRLNVQYPMLFKLTNKQANRSTHCGVLEFVAEEGRIYIPYWMLKNLLLEEGDVVSVDNSSLPIASFARFQPQSVDFLDISNPKAVLENALRSFACLTVDDIITINYNDHNYELRVLETKPKDAVSIIECDMSVDFASPVGYETTESSSVKKHDSKNSDKIEDEHVTIPEKSTGFQAFRGAGYRLDGKNKAGPNVETSINQSGSIKRERAVPNYDYQPGTLTFLRNSRKTNIEKMDEDEIFKPFGGAGYQLKSNANC